MKTKITLIAASSCLWLGNVLGQALNIVPPSLCNNDLNGFVNYKNTIVGTGAYQLQNGFEEKASQTYNYSGPGKIISVRVSGSCPFGGYLSGVPLKVAVYNVDASGKPTSQIASRSDVWWSHPSNSNGYMDFTFPSGINVSNRFAVSVEIINAFPYGNIFSLKYTGNGEGGGQDLASLSGTSTGNNWASAKNSFSKDGDFYIVPNMAHTNTPIFSANSTCYAVNDVVTFTNATQMTKDSMFNQIARLNYSGANKFYKWNFGDGSAVSNIMNPTHTYTTGGVYTTTLTTTIEGWAGTCIKSFTSSVSVGLLVSSTSVVNVNCYGGSNGSFNAVGQFGAAPYSYSKNGTTWQSGTAFTNLTAGTYTLHIKDAKGCLNTSLVTITQPTGISINTILTTNASCGTSTGAFTSSVTGGVAPLSYKLDFGTYGSTGNYNNLSAGPHLFTIKDANGCTTSTLVIINSLTGPTMLFPNINNVSCNAGNDGSISLSSFGGTGLIQYSIDGGTTYQTSGVFNNISAGSYTCVVKDNAGCTNHMHVTISQGPILSVALSSIQTLCNGSNDGQINATSIGGTGIRNYSLNGITYQSGSNFSGLSAGTYTVFVKDITSCVKTQTVIVNQPSVLTASVSAIAASCFGSENGSISVTAFGGNGGYSYSINGGESSDNSSFDYLPAATYTVLVEDENMCSTSSIITVNQPAKITATVNTTNATCGSNNGIIQAIATGGSGSGYQYSIDGISFVGSGVFSSQGSGTHFIVIQDGTGCNTTVSGLIISAGGPTITTSSSQNISCHGGSDGSITINTVIGGTGILNYSKDGVTFQTSNVLTGLSEGTYFVQVKDANSCVATVSVNLSQPNAFLIAPISSSVSCHGSATGSSTIAASGGAGFLAYSLNGGFSYQSGTVFNGLSAGAYTVTVKDAANCTGTSLFTISQPKQITLVVGALNATCYSSNDGEITVSASGGVSPFLYSISGVTYSSINTFTNLAGNSTYTVYTKDANNCIVATSQFITEPTLLSISPIASNVSCAGGNNGIINLNVNGGVSPYYYQWSNGATTSSNSNLTAGSYSVTVNDYNGCSGVKTFTLTQPLTPLIVNGVVIDATTSISLNGNIDVTMNGGTAPYVYSWSNGATSEDLSGLNPGSYLVTITDSKGCTTSNTFIVGISTGLASVQITTSDVKIYPNPANDYATIEVVGYKIDKIELVNLLGQTIFITEVNASLIRFGTSDLTNGTYFVKITSNNNTITKKINISK
jgi:hypothetical protein